MTVSNRIVPQMLQLTLDGNPLVYHNGGQGSVISEEFVLMQNPLNSSAKVATVLAKPFVSMIEKGRIKSTSEEGQALLDYWLDTVRETVRVSFQCNIFYLFMRQRLPHDVLMTSYYHKKKKQIEISFESLLEISEE